VRLLAIGVAVSLASWPGAASGDRAGTDGERAGDGSLDESLDASEADKGEAESERSHWNEYDGRLITARFGGGLLLDFVGYEQDDPSKKQLDLSPTGKLRDLRFLLKGRFKFLPRVSYTLGYMFDAARDSWRFRQTGLMIDVPELSGQLFVGRTKEGFSTNKLMVGYFGWTMERSAANDAFLPILADGVKWTGSLASGQLVYNAGWFIDTLSENESYNKNDRQFAARAVWLPFHGTGSHAVLHLALEGRYGASNDGFLRFRSKPESFPAQSYAVDTDKIPSTSHSMLGLEAYYRPGPFMMGSEYFFNRVASDQTGNPFFHGGEIFASYLFTGEEHPYNERGAFFEQVTPRHPAFRDGTGAWEAVVRYSYVTLDSGMVRGGTFSRITPMINWYWSQNLRFEFAYGYSWLDRFDVVGHTQYFQARVQLSL
jgi:phosphate-selective porin OprO/OprP